MFTERSAYRVAMLTALVTLAAATTLPMVFKVVLAGGFAPQYGEASLATLSPVAAVAVALLLGLAGGAALTAEPRLQAHRVGLIGVALIGATLLATAYMFSPLAQFGFHPLGLSAVALGGSCLLLAAWLGQRVSAST
ncbi:MAG: hypothetical protein U0840_25435 [Gemmataceae bacterium]